MPRRRGKKMELLNETSESATASDAEVMESIEAHGEEFEGKTVLPLCKFIKRAAPDVDPPNISTYNCKLLTLDPLADKNGGENLLMLPQKGPFRLVGDFDVDGEHEDEKAIRRRITRNGGCATFSAIIVQYAIGMDPEPQLWARDIDNRAWLRIEPSISYKDVFDRAIQAATLVYGVLDLEDEFSEKKKVLDVNSVMYEVIARLVLTIISLL
ncbi:hypothetical protein BGZ60DRAFT_285114 [Tricladium varicosporioides]|nr:hypothetical protein BGZ60DRAFT_285114 [Hymenoscyphus varicosporioides]